MSDLHGGDTDSRQEQQTYLVQDSLDPFSLDSDFDVSHVVSKLWRRHKRCLYLGGWAQTEGAEKVEVRPREERARRLEPGAFLQGECELRQFCDRESIDVMSVARLGREGEARCVAVRRGLTGLTFDLREERVVGVPGELHRRRRSVVELVFDLCVRKVDVDRLLHRQL